MARPRVFISSTYYDLKYIRSSLELFIESLGYDAVLSEKGEIAYSPDAPLDESCYGEVANVDIFVLIIGGRYGAEASEGRSEQRSQEASGFYKRYESITKKEYLAAVERDIPNYILIERSVDAEYYTFQKNKDNLDVQYAHVDSVNVFHFIEYILGQARNNPKQTFDRYADIELWLREQWAGLFRDLLQRRSSQRQISSLGAQVSELAEVTETLKTYLEKVLETVEPNASPGIIQAESNRLADARQVAQLENNLFVKYLRQLKFSESNILSVISASDPGEFYQRLLDFSEGHLGTGVLMSDMGANEYKILVNLAREKLAMPPLFQDVKIERSVYDWLIAQG